MRSRTISTRNQSASTTVTATWRGAKHSPSRKRKIVSQWPTTACFTIRFPLTARGSRRRTTAMSGSRSLSVIRIGGRIPGAAGFVVIEAGIGFRKNRSVGRLTTTGAGRCCVDEAGFGCPDLSGLQAGFLGGKMTATSAGPRYLPRHWPTVAMLGTRRWTSSSASARLGLTS